MIAIDTNILVYAHREKTAEHKKVIKAMNTLIQSEQRWGISYPCLAEFWSIVTHPKASGRPSTTHETQEFIRRLLDEAGAVVWYPGPDFSKRLMQLAKDLKINGVRIFDLQIALMAYEGGATTLWTHDKNFIKLPGLLYDDPLK